MSRRLSIPLITLVLVLAPAWWAWPEGLPPWRSAAIVSGWIAWGLLLASLLLMIREAWLADRLGGLARMYAWHHRLGVLAYFVLLLHPLALALDGWHESPAMAWAELSPGQQGWAEWFGWLALLAMMVGLASALARRLAYRHWRWLHHLFSVSVLLGLAHLLWLGLDAPALWAPLLALAFIFWRVLRADQGWGARPYLVTGVVPAGDAMVEVALRPLGQALDFLPGQFVLAAFFDGPGFRGCGEFHPFTVSGVGPAGRFSLGIKALGDCTRRLQALESGVAARVQGPFGDFLSELAGPQFWLAGGVGVTPFMARLRAGALAQPVHLLYLHRDAGDAAYDDELQALAAQQPLLRLESVTCGAAPPDLSLLLPAAGELAGSDCYLCGPPGMIAAAVRVLAARQVPPARTHFESFDFR